MGSVEVATPFLSTAGHADNGVETTIPAGLKLIPADKLDSRSDEEIATWLQQRHPVTSEKNIWAFWDSGYSKMAPWVQRNVISWVRRLGSEWTVHMLDHVPGSETNVVNYIEDSLLPEVFKNYSMDGIYKGTHESDLIRLPLLWQHGGIWMDAGTFLFRHVEDICWKQIEDPESPHEIAAFLMHGVMINGFIACKKGNTFIKRWHDIFLKMWESGVTNTTNFHKHPLVNHLPIWESPSPVVSREHLADYVAHFLCLDRLRKLVDTKDGFNGAEYFAKRIFFTDALKEVYLLQVSLEWSGQRQYDLMALPRTGDGAVKDERWQQAEDHINTLVANSSVMKLSHGPAGMWGGPTLAHLWDMGENADADIVPGSFGEYLRYASVHYDQTRKVLPLPDAPVCEDLIHAGLLEENKQVEKESNDVL